MYKKYEIKIALLFGLFILLVITSYTLYRMSALGVYEFTMLIALFIFSMLSVIFPVSLSLILGIAMVMAYGSLTIYQILVVGTIDRTINYSILLGFPLIILTFSYISSKISKLYSYALECEHIKSSLVTIDELTGYGTTSMFYKILEAEIAVSQRYSSSLSLMIFEIQYFDELLSIYGEVNTEKTLTTLAHAIDEITRKEDYKFRLDKNLFGLILPKVDDESCRIIKSKVKESINHLEIEVNNTAAINRIDIKVGIKAYDSHIGSSFEFKNKTVEELVYDV